MSSQHDGAVDLGAIKLWLQAQGIAPHGELRAEQIHGGRSNLTYFIVDNDGCRWVLRRPPFGHVLATAHDVEREVRVLRALQGVMPVPEVIGSGRNADDIPFYMMHEVDGLVIRRSADTSDFSPQAISRIGIELIGGLAALHAVDVNSVGLAAMGKGTGYLERQIRMWQRHGDEHRARPFPEADSVRDRLLQRAPQQSEITLVHGDYRLDNVMLAEDGSLRAILDWELCTRGDPLADLAVCLLYWTDASDAIHPFVDPPTVEEGFASRADLLAEYERCSGRAVADLDFYMAYAAWRLALVFEGVRGRSSRGAYGAADSVEERRLEQVTEQLVAHADARLRSEVLRRRHNSAISS